MSTTGHENEAINVQGLKASLQKFKDDYVTDVAYLEEGEGSAAIADFDPQTDTVWKKAQTLSNAEKAQVKTNLGLPNEVYSKTEVNELVSTPHQNYVTVSTYAELPASGSTDTIYRVSNYDGTQVAAGVYSEYAWSGSAYVFLAAKSSVGEVFDISEYHAGTKYANLAAALDSNNGGGVPQSLQKGGMSVKYVSNSDNKYVQYRYMLQYGGSTTAENNKFKNPDNWQGVDSNIKGGSKNLIESGAVFVDNRYIKDELGIDVYAFEYEAAGEQPYPIKSGKTYIIHNTTDTTITVSFRKTPSGESHCDTSMVAGASAEVTADDDYAWVRCGRAATFTIREKVTINSRIDNLETGLSAEVNKTQSLENNTLELFSKVSAYLVEWELGQTYINSNNELVYQKSTTAITLKRGLHYLHLYPGDIITVSDSDYSNKMISVGYHNGDGIWHGFGWQLQDFTVQTEGYYWVGMSYRPQSTISDVEELSKYFQIKSLKQRINEVQGQTAEIRDCLFVTPDSIVQVGKGVNASTGAYIDVDTQSAVSLDLSQINAKYIRFIWTVSGTYGYGFFVGGTWQGYKISSFPSGLYYQETTVKVPAGATEFRFSWSTNSYTGDNHPRCILTDGLSAAYDTAKNAVEGLAIVQDALYKEKTLNVSPLISNGGVKWDGTISDSTSIGHIEIQLNGTISYKSFTFKRTYLNPANHCCYGFLVNNQWIGYNGNASASDSPTEITVEVPVGATVFKVCWNRNQLKDANFYLKANLFENTGDEERNNAPVFQFTPDFVLSRVPTYQCPTSGEAGNLKPAGLYSMYDALMAAYPDYITKVDCDAGAQAALGITAPEYLDGLPIYMYKLTPKIGGNGSGIDQTNRVKVLITSMHPQEKLGLYSMYYTIKMICENWEVARFNITKSTSNVQPSSGIEIHSDPAIDTGVYYINELTAFDTLPSDIGNDYMVTYWLSNEGNPITYTKWEITMLNKTGYRDINVEQFNSLIDIYVLPCPWPWNMENNSRNGYNGPNGNRQFPTRNWRESGDTEHQNWTGTAPLSEYEAKVINYYLSQIKPDVCLDVHTSGNDDVGHMGIMIVNKYDQPLVDLCGIIARTTSNIAKQASRNFPLNPNICLYGVYPKDGSAMGEFYEYAYEQGCKYSILCEESPYSKWDNGVFDPQASIVEQYTDGIQKEQIQYIFNILMRLTKAACEQYYTVL